MSTFYKCCPTSIEWIQYSLPSLNTKNISDRMNNLRIELPLVLMQSMSRIPCVLFDNSHCIVLLVQPLVCRGTDSIQYICTVVCEFLQVIRTYCFT